MKYVGSKITNIKTNESESIIAKSKLPCKWQYFVIGTLLNVLGTAVLATASFKHGARRFDIAEDETYHHLGLIDGVGYVDDSTHKPN